PLWIRRGRCYVARLAGLRPGSLRTSPAGHGGSARQTRRTSTGRSDAQRGTSFFDLHTLWTLLWTREGWGAVTADEIWDQGAAALRSQLAPATWAAWFHGVRPVSYLD